MVELLAATEEADVAKSDDVGPALFGLMHLGYSQDRIAKKIPSVTSWVVARLSSEVFCLLIAGTTDMGTAAWCFSGGSLFLNDLNSPGRIYASWLSSLRVGLGYPCSRKDAERYWMVPPTVFAANCP